MSSIIWEASHKRHYKKTPNQYTENFTSKNWKISDKNLWYFSYSAPNIDCEYSLEPPRRGGSNEYAQPLFSSIHKKNNLYPCKPQFTIKWGLRGGGGLKLYRHIFVMSVHARLLGMAIFLVLGLVLGLTISFGLPHTLANSTGFGETAWMRRLARIFAVCICYNDFSQKVTRTVLRFD